MASALSVDLRERVVAAIGPRASRRGSAECRRYLAAAGDDAYDPT